MSTAENDEKLDELPLTRRELLKDDFLDLLSNKNENLNLES